jgi:pimeloyl-ACP methyl ester carboxylesterase
MAYWQWGDALAAHVVVCVHGLSRQGRDFDVLAQALCARSGGRLRVVCPDVAGRGRSEWLKDPSLYQIPAYAGDMLALLAQLQPAVLDWVGTSMGGLIGMVVCGQPGLPLPVPVRRLVLNDVGPAIRWEAIERIKTYLGDTGRFDSLEAAAAAMRAVSLTFGPHTDAQWLALSRHMVRPLDGQGGALTLHYDPAIAVPVRATTAELSAQGESMLWQLYDNIQARTLLLRGADSDLLTPQTAAAMAQRGPRAQVVEFAGVGHAPTLVADDQVDCVARFLLD